MNHATIVHDGCLNAMSAMADSSIDVVITDPPYGLSATSPGKVADTVVRWAAGERRYVPTGSGFMAASWDAFVPPPAVWDECLRVLRPGGHMMVFAGPRTMDLMTLAIRLAGFEIRDALAWVYGSGMPHGLDVSKAIDKRDGDSQASARWSGWNTALKPAFEPIILARKPLEGSTVDNVTTHGTGALNIDACRIAHQDEADRAESEGKNRHADFGSRPDRSHVYGDFSTSVSTNYTAADGRWPANVVLDPSQADVLDAQSSGASRFFYCARASNKERPAFTDDDGKTARHNTVKPLALMRWLVRLGTPPGGIVLDPFAGSGTTAEAALLEGFNTIAIESDDRHCRLIEQRCRRTELSWTKTTSSSLG